MKLNRFHIFYSLHFVRKWVLLCLVPMVRALVRFDWPSLVLALRQDAVILALILIFSAASWYKAGWQLNSDLLTARMGLLLQARRQVRRTELASVVITRPFLFRLVGASRLTLYMQRSRPAALTLYLPREDAARLAQALMPAEEEQPVFAPVGAEKLSLTVLGFNVTLTGLMALYSARKTAAALDPGLERAAWEQLLRVEALVGQVLPAGLAWLVTLSLLFYAALLGYNFLCRAGLKVARGPAVMVARYGLLRLTERRIRLSAVTGCTVQVTPAARLLGRYPVYLSAGFDKGMEAPLFLCKKGEWNSLRRLMPGLHLPPSRYGPAKGRSRVAFFWLPGGGAALCLAGLALGPRLWPGYGFVFLLGLAFFAALGLVAAEGYRREGAGRRKGSLTLCFTRRLTRYEVCLFTDRLSTAFWQNPFSRRKGRGTLLVKLPAGFYKIRSLRAGDAAALGL